MMKFMNWPELRTRGLLSLLPRSTARAYRRAWQGVDDSTKTSIFWLSASKNCTSSRGCFSTEVDRCPEQTRTKRNHFLTKNEHRCQDKPGQISVSWHDRAAVFGMLLRETNYLLNKHPVLSWSVQLSLYDRTKCNTVPV